MALKFAPFRRIKEIVRHYLESGFYDLGQTARCNADTYHPAVLRFISPIAAYVAANPEPLEGAADVRVVDNPNQDAPYFGQQLIDGQDSLSVGGALQTSVTDPCGNSYASALAEWSKSDIWMQKVCQLHVPSSMYSGKMRLWVQAMYGSMRTDYSIALDSAGLPDVTQFYLHTVDADGNDFALPRDMATSGLYTTSDYRYFAMRVGVGSISFAPLRLTAAGEYWRDILAAHPNCTDKAFATRVEAYILADAKPDTALTQVVSTGLSVSGSPVAYGFKFNWSGTQAKVVLHNEYGVASQFSAVEVTHDISFDTVSGLFSVISSTSTPKTWWHSPYFTVWKPTWSLDGMMHWQMGASQYLGAVMDTADCPIYGYYDYSDTYIRYDFSISTASYSAVTVLETDTYDPTGTQSTPAGPMFTTQASTTQPGAIYNSSLSGGASLSGYSNTGKITRITKEWYQQAPAGPPLAWYKSTDSGQGNTAIDMPRLLNAGGTVVDYMVANKKWAQTSPGVYGATYPGGFGWVVGVYRAHTSNIRTTMNGTITVEKISLIAPHNDAEAIIFGKRSYTTADSKIVIDSTEEANFFTAYLETQLIPIGGSGTNGNGSDPQYLIRDATGYTGYKGTTYSSSSVSLYTGDAASIAYTWGGLGGPHASGGEAVIKSASGLGAADWELHIFSGSLTNPLVDEYFLSTSSTQGASKLQYYDSTTGLEANLLLGYPVDCFSAVGWA